jgi:hypothetical protein
MTGFMRKASFCPVVAVTISCFPGCRPEQRKAKHLKRGDACQAESKTRRQICL